MKKIGIVVAQEKECVNLFSKLGKCEIINLYAGFSVKKFTLYGKEIYFAASGMGEIRAAIAVQRLIDNFEVDCVINFGVAGGLKKGTRGNIYIMEGVVHYDFDTSAIDPVRRGEYVIFGDPVIKTDENLRTIAKTILSSAEYAVCASADKFVSDPVIKEGLVEEFGATVCEMESAGVLIASRLSNVPCAVLKIVSDDDVDPDDYYRFLENMTDALNELIVKMIEKI